MNAVTPSFTIVGVLAARSESRALDRGIRWASVLFVSALTAAAAQFSAPIPFTSVPFTLQPMIVLLGGLVLGARLGLASQAMYLMAGLAGVSVFAPSPNLLPGPLRLLGPTGGYLMAYPVAAFVTGWLAEHGFDRRYITSVLAMCAGLAIIYAGGVTWLALFARAGSDRVSIGVWAALGAGAYPFILPDLMKVLVTAGVVPGLWRLLGEPSRRGPTS